MTTWADELRYNIEHIGTVGAVPNERMLLAVEIGERQLKHAHDTIEALVESNAALRSQLHELRRGKGE